MARSVRIELPALVKAGWPRPEDNIPVPLHGADGVVGHNRLFGSITNRPGCSICGTGAFYSGSHPPRLDQGGVFYSDAARHPDILFKLRTAPTADADS